MKYIIEKNIPIPDKSNRKYPWDKMEVGDSFLINEYSPAKLNNVMSSSKMYASLRNLDVKFVARKVGENQIRVWRTK